MLQTMGPPPCHWVFGKDPFWKNKPAVYVLVPEDLWHGPVKHPHVIQILFPCMEGRGLEPQ